MRTTVTYHQSLQHMWQGISGIMLCLAQTIMTNKTMTLLIISVLFNISLMASLAGERISRQRTSARLYEVETQNDSLRGADIHY